MTTPAEEYADEHGVPRNAEEYAAWKQSPEYVVEAFALQMFTEEFTVIHKKLVRGMLTPTDALDLVIILHERLYEEPES